LAAKIKQKSEQRHSKFGNTQQRSTIRLNLLAIKCYGRENWPEVINLYDSWSGLYMS
jgi:hypothetical protein